jgi:class 3 adenylate cyclase/tetratricopeptide (TPR) repeat protein
LENHYQVICPSCGQESPAGFRFCGACGAALVPEPQAEVRKTVTILFCDLVGSTALGERTDPEVLREIMTRYHAELRAILERHGASVEKFVGDAAMAIFGLPQVHEDDALRAVRAAVEMRDAVGALGLDVRIGVNTGEVVAGTGETLATGDAVNVAARLEQAAGAGEVLIGSATERLVRDSVRAENVEPLALKGKSEPVRAFTVFELVDDVPAFTRPIETPFVGRDDELEQLERALSSAVEDRTPRLATVMGSPGIGKSRLVREVVGRTHARVVVGRCLQYGEGITYWPLREIAAQVGDVRAALHGASDAELAAVRIEAALGATDTPVSPDEIAWGVRKLFEALASSEPLVVVFDDIHWAEPALLDLVEYVAAFAQDVPLLVLCTARPDLSDLRPTWTAPRPNSILIALEALSGADSETLAEQLGNLPEATRERIVEVAEGNPLFVEQLVAMQVESGNGDLEVPPTLQALLAARIDRLAEPERAVVQRGSVEGRLFHRGAVVALLPEPERPEVGAHLLTLVRKELIRPDRATLPGDDGFRFSHILIRDAAYEAIPKRRRATLHERFAGWLVERLGAEAPDEFVGYHLEQAYRYRAELGAPDRALGALAAGRLEAAARTARARGDVAAAVNLLGRAAELVPEGPARPGLLAEQGEVLREAGGLAQAESVLEESVALAREAGDERAEWLGRLALADVRSMREPEGAAEHLLREAQAGLAVGEAAGDDEVLAKAWGLMAEAHNVAGRMTEQARALERAVPHARRAGDLRLEATLVTTKAPYFIWGPGQVEEGLRFVDSVIESLGHVPGVQAFALHVRAHLRARLGEFDGAFEDVGEFRRGLRELRREREYAVTSGCGWDVCLWAGEWLRGEEALREGYVMIERMGIKALLSKTALDLGDCVLRLGRLDEAERLSEIGEEVTPREDVFCTAQWLTLRSRVRAARGDLAGAETFARRAVELPTADEFLELAADARLALAEALRLAGAAGAQEPAAEALELYERKGNLVGAQRVRAFLDAGRT